MATTTTTTRGELTFPPVDDFAEVGTDFDFDLGDFEAGAHGEPNAQTAVAATPASALPSPHPPALDAASNFLDHLDVNLELPSAPSLAPADGSHMSAGVLLHSDFNEPSPLDAFNDIPIIEGDDSGRATFELNNQMPALPYFQTAAAIENNAAQVTSSIASEHMSDLPNLAQNFNMTAPYVHDAFPNQHVASYSHMPVSAELGAGNLSPGQNTLTWPHLPNDASGQDYTVQQISRPYQQMTGTPNTPLPIMPYGSMNQQWMPPVAPHPYHAPAAFMGYPPVMAQTPWPGNIGQFPQTYYPANRFMPQLPMPLPNYPGALVPSAAAYPQNIARGPPLHITPAVSHNDRPKSPDSSRPQLGNFNKEPTKPDRDRPWVRVNDRLGMNSRGGKLNRYRASDFYEQAPSLPAWNFGGHNFRYNEDGELHKDEYSAAAIDAFLRGHDQVHQAQYGKLRVWIQKTPADSARRYPRPGSNRCLFEECPLRRIGKVATIWQGHLRVAFDEKYDKYGKSGPGPVPDPFIVAGYVHLYCFERFIDMPAIAQIVDIAVDCRDYETEPNGVFAAKIGRADARYSAAVKFSGQTPKQFSGSLVKFPSKYPKHAEYNGAPKPHERTLNFVMQKAYVEGWSAPKKRIMAKRDTDTALSATIGDLEKYIAAKWPKILSITDDNADNEQADVANCDSEEHRADGVLKRKRPTVTGSRADTSDSDDDMIDADDDSSEEKLTECGQWKVVKHDVNFKQVLPRRVQASNASRENTEDSAGGEQETTNAFAPRRSSRLLKRR